MILLLSSPLLTTSAHWHNRCRDIHSKVLLFWGLSKTRPSVAAAHYFELKLRGFWQPSLPISAFLSSPISGELSQFLFFSPFLCFFASIFTSPQLLLLSLGLLSWVWGEQSIAGWHFWGENELFCYYWGLDMDHRRSGRRPFLLNSLKLLFASATWLVIIMNDRSLNFGVFII